MASIVPGYNYDIFISYRQKDNRHDGWVTDFVDNLKGELESTFKEEISVYFDINPHDGLLETHDVDASLKEKLNCLIFIPVISRTYCDPKSFAWEHEFKAFVEKASKDQFGLKVTLPNGNVASRVLPVRIHELDNDDIEECENVLGGFLRGVEFVYKERGIDKPLSENDDEQKNLNKTKYRIQVIKVVHAIKELIQGISNEPVRYKKDKKQSGWDEEGPGKQKSRHFLSGIKLLLPVIIILFIIAAGLLAWPKMFGKNALDDLRSAGKISVAVMPFRNMTIDSTWNIWQYGIQNELISNLSNSDEVIIRPLETVSRILQSYNGVLTISKATDISSNLEADVFILGDIKQIGTNVRFTAQIFHTRTKEILKSFPVDEPSGKEGIFHVTEKLSGLIKNYLVITLLKKETTPAIHVLGSTKDPEALKNYIEGISNFFKGEWSVAEDYFTRAVSLDPEYSMAKVMSAHASTYNHSYLKAKKLIREVYEKRDSMSRMDKLFTEWSLALLCGYPEEEVKYMKQMIEATNGQNAAFHSDLGEIYTSIKEYDKAIFEHEKALELFSKWSVKPMWISCYTSLGKAYHETSQYKKEKTTYLKAEKYFPGDTDLLKRQSILFLSKGRESKAVKYLNKYISVCRDMSISDSEIESNCGSVYAEAGKQDKAEEHYRQALSMDTENPERMNDLSYFLIYYDRNVNEGMELISQALALSPENFEYLNTEGLGLYKQHKYEESLKVLRSGWDSRMMNSVYNHEAFLNLEAAEKAVSEIIRKVKVEAKRRP